ncbi:MAG TPA: 2,3-bisphosphoglycerate-independent phosphoglycerate mutase [Candidatus Eremiobacteraceae bacterium]|nr:2,3-bisphosphoglycerate-independent phosphoglycerate mutase [Candidatus Eremiobacteraceae bacterium]
MPADGRRNVVLCVLDGFGCSQETRGNAIAAANLPNYRRIAASYPYTEIGAAEEAVGLPKGQQGNSEVGHLNLGAGRVVLQSVTRIDHDIDDGTFALNPVLQECFAHVRRTGGTLQLLGLVSPGGVHSSMKHLYALMDAAAAAHVPVKIAAFLDGRDTPPQSAGPYLQDVEARCRALGQASISSLCGRYYAMDRDQRWERTRIAYDALVNGKADTAPSIEAALQAAYARGETDEFVRPVIIGQAQAIVQDGDACLFFNFRPDRARQLTRAFSDPAFREFPVKRFTDFLFALMTLYEETFPNPVMYGKIFERWTLGEVVADAGLPQLRLAETEKYAHVTYFFSGGREEPFPGEARILVPSAREVGTYDKKPEMRAREITEKAVESIRSGRYPLIVMNYANPDMVGHTGKWLAIIAGLEVVDECLGRLEAAALAANAVLLVTADHGNAEEKVDLATGKELTAHTCNPVPFIAVSKAPLERLAGGGKLADVAPAICQLLDLPQPAVMTGHSLLASTVDAAQPQP